MITGGYTSGPRSSQTGVGPPRDLLRGDRGGAGARRESLPAPRPGMRLHSPLTLIQVGNGGSDPPPDEHVKATAVPPAHTHSALSFFIPTNTNVPF